IRVSACFRCLDPAVPQDPSHHGPSWSTGPPILKCSGRIPTRFPCSQRDRSAWKLADSWHRTAAVRTPLSVSGHSVLCPSYSASVPYRLPFVTQINGETVLVKSLVILCPFSCGKSKSQSLQVGM